MEMTHTYHVIDTYVLHGLAHTCQSSDTYVSFQASHIRIWNEVDSAFAEILALALSSASMRLFPSVPINIELLI